MIQGLHAMLYSSEPEASRAFLRDVLGFSFTDVGGGWLIFDMPEADLGIHPTSVPAGTPTPPAAEEQPTGTPSISFYCASLEQTMMELREKGVEFTREVEDHGYGLVTFFRMPGDMTVQLYQPLYQKGAAS